MFGLVDGNNFYASVERIFNPALRSQPVCILSNNDGCAIARSQEDVYKRQHSQQPGDGLRRSRLATRYFAIGIELRIEASRAEHVLSLIHI